VRILLVEDSRILRRENQTALLKVGHEVICAEDGEIALQLAHDCTPDLILLDMIIPKVNGPEVLKRLKSDPDTSHIPVVVVSSLSEKNREKLIAVGALDYLEKNELMPAPGVNLLPKALDSIICRMQQK
jgi:CheY-like chemotaxis protein